MKITYSAEVDVAYVYLTEERGNVDTVVVDPDRVDLMLDFDFSERLVGIEVLDASIRLDLKHLRPYIDKIDGPPFRWSHFKLEMREFLEQESGLSRIPTVRIRPGSRRLGKTPLQFAMDRTGEIREITRAQLEELDITPSKAIREMGILHTLYEMGRPNWPAKALYTQG